MPRRPNFMIVITDQQSANPYWPEGWEEQLAERYGFDGWTMPDAGDNLARKD